MMNLNQLQSQTLLDAMTSGVLIVDAQQQVVTANPAIAKLLGNPLKALIGQPLSTLIELNEKTDCPLCQAIGERFLPVHGGILCPIEEVCELETAEDLDKAEMEDRRVKIRHSPLPDGMTLCLIDLFSEDAALTRAHNDFVSTVTHEFRTPLTSIKGFADTLLKYDDQLPVEEKRRFVAIIKDQADRLIRLVENLLTTSKVGANRLEMSYRPVLLKRLLEKVTQSIAVKMESKSPPHACRFKIAVQPDTLELWVDPDRLEQVLLNLIDNAVKYSPPGSTVGITGGFLPNDDTQAQFIVRDEGMGIDPDALPRIFTKFYRAKNPMTSDVEGTGLGLYITQALVQAMGGKIQVESAPGEGTTFTVILPSATPERQAQHRRHLYAQQQEGMR